MYPTNTPSRNTIKPFVTLAVALVGILAGSCAQAGGYVPPGTALNPAKAINTGGATITPTFNNDQFNDKLLVGTVNNDAIRTPSTADPVSTVSGNNYHDETDFTIRGRNGLNYVFTRTYNSAPSATSLDRGLGFGWTHSYLMQLKSNDFGDCPNCSSTQKSENANSKTSSITYTDERGGEQNYLVNETSYAVTSPKGVFDTLALDTPAAGQHTLTFRNGVKYIFETPTGNLKTTPNVISRLKYIDNAWGDRLTLTYDANGRLSTITDNLAISGRTGLVFTYYTSGTSNGHLKDVTDWSGRKWIFNYDANLNLTTKTNPLTEVLTYGYDVPTSHLLTDIIKPLQRDGLPVKTTFSYYQNGRTFQQLDSYGYGDTLDYDLYRKSTRVTDARGNVREYFYDENGRMTQLNEPDGAILYFENQGDAVRSKKYDALGYATTYSYRTDKAYTGSSDAAGQVTRELDAKNQTTDFTYGPLDQVATVKDKRGATTTTTYGTANGSCDRVNRPKETRISALSGASNVLLASQCWNSDNTLNYSRRYLTPTRYIQTTLTYQPGTNRLNVQQAQSVGMPANIAVTTTYTYDNLGRKKTETLKRRTSPTNAALIDITTSWEYDALDRVTKITDALGNEQINRYDANGQIWQVTHRYKKPDATYDVRNVVTRTFDAADRVKTETNTLGFVTTYDYDEVGNLISVLDAEDHTSRFEYDAMNRRTAVEDATGYRTETEYNLRGDVLAITNANGERAEFEFDELGRKSASVDPLGYRTEYSYDANNNLTCVIDPNAQAGLQPKNTLGCSESRSYDELNRVNKITDALNGETIFTYDYLGNRLTVKDAELKTWTFNYDDLGRLISEVDHSNKTISYKPDEAGNIYEKTNRLLETTRFTYDKANRIGRVDYLKDNSAETYSYYPDGNLDTVANDTISYSFDYDSLNRLLSKNDSRGRSLGFTYDHVGNVLTKTTYQGSTTAYVYNAANRLVYLRNPDYLEVDYQYDPAGRLLSRVTSSGARTLYHYLDNGFLQQLDQYNAAGTQISGTVFTRDRVGNILTRQDGSVTVTYGYDALYRLRTADHPVPPLDESYTYDKVGNRKTVTLGSLTANSNTRYYNYVSGSNRLYDIRIGSTSGTLESGFTFDNEGRLTAQTGVGARSLTWDAKGRIKTLTQSGTTETYSYDPTDHRVGRSGGALGSLNYFLEGEHLESIYKGSTLEAKYLRGSNIDELVAGYLKDTDSKLKPYIFSQDNLTSTSAVSGPNGTVNQSVQYTAFGNVRINSGTSPNRLKYTGREDDNTGLYYYRARYYDSQIGRFLSEDSKGFAAGINFYAYVGNNPINANDPTGKLAQYAAGVAVGAVGGLVVQGGIDWAKGELSPISDYAGAIIGGGAGGAAAVTCGPACAGATAGAVSSATTQGINWAQGQVTSAYDAATSFLTSTALGAVGGKVADKAVPWLFKEALPAVVGTGTANQVKGAVGEALTWLDLTLTGRGIAETQASNGFGKSTFDFLTSSGIYVEAKFGTSQLNRGAQSQAADYWGSLGLFELQSWSYPTVSGLVGSGFSGGAAGGGFLLYPNKSNINMSQSVYAK